VLLDPVDALDEDPVGVGVDGDDLALFALVLAGDDLDGSPFLMLSLGVLASMVRAPPEPAR
jgi:hypothetical protein